MVALLTTKLFIPSVRQERVARPRLIERLNEGLNHMPSVTLISAPAGFGKTTLVSEWTTDCGQPVAWLSLDEGDNDPGRFLTYFISALQSIAGTIGEGVLATLQSPQLPALEPLLTSLLNEITSLPEKFILVLDDYHMIEAQSVDYALNFLIEHQPPQMHLVITTREDPNLPLARLRAHRQLTELRAAELRFTPAEAADFLNQTMGLSLSPENVTALENRTEGWIAGLQLAALALQGDQDATNFIKSFSGSHRFVMDYLAEEVLGQQPENIQTFLLRTSVLERLCGPLCDAVVLDLQVRGKETLEYLERSNLFIIPLDSERRWYRYHHLFAELLQQRLQQSITSSTGDPNGLVNELHIRASQWYEENGFELDAFRHAAAAKDIERAEHLSDKMPTHFRGNVVAILDWLASLPNAVLDARPWLWWRYAALLLISGQITGVEEKLAAAEAALQGKEPNDQSRNLVGRVAAARATAALTRYDAESMILQSRRALEYLEPENLALRANAYWTLGEAHFFQGDRVHARQFLMEALSLSQAAGAIFTSILATIGLGNLQEADNQLYLAAETYQRILQMAGDQPLQIIGEVHLGLARVLYEWNDLNAAEEHGQQSLQLERQYDTIIDRFILGEVFLARVKLAQGDIDGAASILAQADQSAHQKNFVHRFSDVAAAQVLTLLRQGNLTAAAHLAQTHNLPLDQVRVYLAQNDPSSALKALELLRLQAEAKGWEDERLKVLVLEALALYLQGEKSKALQVLGNALELAEPGGFIRLFVDEALPMEQLLSEGAAKGMTPNYIEQLLDAFKAEKQKQTGQSPQPAVSSLIEPLSQRELEVLQLIAQGLSNDEISKRLFLALDTVKGHNRKIFDKLQVQRRTEAVARARELGLL